MSAKQRLESFPLGPHGSKFTRERREAMLVFFENGNTIEGVCGNVGINVRTYDRWQQRAAEKKVDDWEDYRDFFTLVELEQLFAQGVLENKVLAEAHRNPEMARKVLAQINPANWGPKARPAVEVKATGDNITIGVRLSGDVDSSRLRGVVAIDVS